jgi:hypothetical protein
MAPEKLRKRAPLVSRAALREMVSKKNQEIEKLREENATLRGEAKFLKTEMKYTYEKVGTLCAKLITKKPYLSEKEKNRRIAIIRNYYKFDSNMQRKFDDGFQDFSEVYMIENEL